MNIAIETATPGQGLPRPTTLVFSSRLVGNFEDAISS